MAIAGRPRRLALVLAPALGIAPALTKGVDRWDRSSDQRIEMAKAHAAGSTIRRP